MLISYPLYALVTNDLFFVSNGYSRGSVKTADCGFGHSRYISRLVNTKKHVSFFVKYIVDSCSKFSILICFLKRPGETN